MDKMKKLDLFLIYIAVVIGITLLRISREYYRIFWINKTISYIALFFHRMDTILCRKYTNCYRIFNIIFVPKHLGARSNDTFKKN